jgi:alkylhydroperoxidase family enzyme
MEDSPTITSEHGPLPLVPIEQPKGWFIRLLYAATRRRYGKTPTAFRVLYARMSGMALLSMVILWVKERFMVLDPALRYLLPVAIASHAGCTFCTDLWKAEAIRNRIGRERFRDLPDYEASENYSEREKAALAYAEAVQRSLHVDQAVLNRLRARFSEREIVEIVWLCAIERYFNSMAIPLRIGSDALFD